MFLNPVLQQFDNVGIVQTAKYVLILTRTHLPTFSMLNETEYFCRAFKSCFTALHISARLAQMGELQLATSEHTL